MRNKRHLILENHTKLFGNFFTRLFETRSKLLLAVTNVLLIAAAVIFTVVYMVTKHCAGGEKRMITVKL